MCAKQIAEPSCPVLRTDQGDWLEQPYLIDFITSPAINAGVIRKNEPHNTVQIAPVLKEHSSKLLALAATRVAMPLCWEHRAVARSKMILNSSHRYLRNTSNPTVHTGDGSARYCFRSSIHHGRRTYMKRLPAGLQKLPDLRA